ncbi:MAG: hypothetical protein ACTHMR_12500 [Thermomicrobiales bacterium]
MPRHKTFLGLLALLVLVGLLATPATALAAETRIAISPGYGPPGTQFAIVVTGLLENGDFSIAVYRLDDGALIGVAPFTADASGTIVATYDSTGDQPGRYQAVVTYLARGSEVIRGDFTVSGPSGASSRYFPETGFTVSGRFLTYWETNGGLALNGYPISDERDETLENGQVYRVQYFERVRIEYHPENTAPNDMLLGQFGRRIHPADPPAEQIVGAYYFSETGHNLSDITADRRTVVNFARYWDNNGGLRQFGYPISEIFPERLEDGNVYLVQYFERARFEDHPEHAGTPYEVLLGQFGRRILAESGH